MDRQGKFTPLRETPADYYSPAFSPDGKRLAVSINEGKKADIWVYEWSRDTLTRLTFKGDNGSPVWTPDGQRVAYVSSEKFGGDEASDIYWTRADGTGDTQRLTETKNQKFPKSWHPNGKLLAFDQLIPGANFNVSTIAVDSNEKLGWKPGETKLLLPSPFLEGRPSFSPDGHWLAYESFSSGNFEVYVRPFPDLGGKWQISTGGGRYPTWSPNGKELFYRTPDDRIMVVTYTVSAGSFRPGKVQLWSPGQFTERFGAVNFALHPDGKRFAVLKAPATAENTPNKVTIIFNFFDELRRGVQPEK